MAYQIYTAYTHPGGPFVIKEYLQKNITKAFKKIILVFIRGKTHPA